MEIVTKTINSNLNVKIIKEKKFKFVNVETIFMLELDYSDIAAFNLLLRLLTSRNNKYPSIDTFNTYLESNYGMIMSGRYSNRGNVAIFDLFVSSMNSKYSINENLLKLEIETLHDCIFNPCFNEESLEEVKRIYIEKLKEQSSKKTYILQKRVNEILGNDSPYGVNIESNIEDLNNVTLDKIKEIYSKLFDSDCKIYVCGDVDQEEVVGYLSTFNLKSSNDSLLNLSYLKDIKDYSKVEFKSNFLQSAINLIYECNINYNDKLFYALKVFLEMFNYDLFNVIREERNFCYYIYAISNNYLNTIQIVSEIESKNLDTIVEIIDNIIKDYDINFNEERFNICKSKILTYIDVSKDSEKDLIDLEFGFDFSKTVSSIEELKEKYIKVTKEEVQEVSKMISLKLVSILKEVVNNG